MNEVRLFGTLTKDPNIRHAEREDGYDVARFTVRVEQGEREDGRTGRTTQTISMLWLSVRLRNWLRKK